MITSGETGAFGSSHDFMLRPSGRLGLALLLAVGFMAPARLGLAQALSISPVRTSTDKSAAAPATTPVRKSNAHAKKATPVAEMLQTPPPTLEQQSPTPPQVSYQDGQLTIESQNATLSQVLHSVQTQTGASVEIPPGTGSERVVARLGPGNPKDVLASLLNGSKFNYVILGEANSSGKVQKVILMTKSATTGGGSAPVTTAQNNFQPPEPSQVVEPPDDDSSQNEPEPEVPLQPGQAGIPGGEQVVPEAPGIQQNPLQPGGRTPEQMLQELQRMQQQQQQLQQQLNPSNQQQGPFPNPTPASPQ
jgi:hypothetical protein